MNSVHLYFLFHYTLPTLKKLKIIAMKVFRPPCLDFSRNSFEILANKHVRSTLITVSTALTWNSKPA